MAKTNRTNTFDLNDIRPLCVFTCEIIFNIVFYKHQKYFKRCSYRPISQILFLNLYLKTILVADFITHGQNHHQSFQMILECRTLKFVFFIMFLFGMKYHSFNIKNMPILLSGGSHFHYRAIHVSQIRHYKGHITQLSHYRYSALLPPKPRQNKNKQRW